MKTILESIIANSGLGFLPAIGVSVLFVTMLAIIWWTYRPANRARYEKLAQLTLDKEI